jgi:cyanoexosortase A
LALLAAPIQELRRFWQAFAILLLLPLLRLLWWAVPTGPFQLASAWFAQQALIVCGYPAVRHDFTVTIPGTSVKVAELCAGINSMLLLLAVAVIFALLFPMRRPWQNLLMVLVAPGLALAVNGVRIAVLALILASSLPNRVWWFEFFHLQWGSYVFSAIAMQLFLWCYVGWMERQVARVEAQVEAQ